VYWDAAVITVASALLLLFMEAMPWVADLHSPTLPERSASPHEDSVVAYQGPAGTDFETRRMVCLWTCEARLAKSCCCFSLGALGWAPYWPRHAGCCSVQQVAGQAFASPVLPFIRPRTGCCCLLCQQAGPFPCVPATQEWSCMPTGAALFVPGVARLPPRARHLFEAKPLAPTLLLVVALLLLTMGMVVPCNTSSLWSSSTAGRLYKVGCNVPSGTLHVTAIAGFALEMLKRLQVGWLQ